MRCILISISILQVSKRIAPKYAYSWEICDIPVVEAIFVDTAVHKSNTVVLKSGMDASINLKVFEYLSIDIIGLETSAIHGYLVITEISTQLELFKFKAQVS